jgi:hypothetical protein
MLGERLPVSQTRAQLELSKAQAADCKGIAKVEMQVAAEIHQLSLVSAMIQGVVYGRPQQR